MGPSNKSLGPTPGSACGLRGIGAQSSRGQQSVAVLGDAACRQVKNVKITRRELVPRDRVQHCQNQPGLWYVGDRAQISLKLMPREFAAEPIFRNKGEEI